MSKANRAVRKIIIIVLTALAVFATGAYAAEPKFRAAPGAEPVVGHYLVRLDDSIVESAVRGSAEGLARTYGGQLEIYASSDIRQFAVVMLPARARTLSADPRVREVVGIAQSDDALTPPPAAAPPLSRHLVPTALDSSSSGTYLYDGSGNIKSIGSDSFYYDVDGRLAKATVLGNQQTFTYDPLGNRLTAARATGAVGCVGGCDIAVTVNQQNNHVSGFTYDEAGNVTNANGPTYASDGTGMVTRAVVASDIRDFLYTVDDERIAVRKGTSWTWSVRDLSGKVLREFTSLETSSPFGLSAHTWSKDYIWRDGQLLASVFPTTEGTISPRTTYHYHLDHLGTPRLITKELGVLVGKHTYYAFGAEMDLTPKEPATERMKFTGHERDIVAGAGNSVDYMHARYYNPTTGRFLSVDPVEGNAQTPQSWNRYVYVTNNPIGKVDPDGRCDAAIAAVGSAACVGQNAVNGVIQDYRDTKEAVSGMGLNASLSENMMGYQVLTLMSAKYAVAFLPVSEGVPTITRYMGEGEALAAKSTGEIPNVNQMGQPRPTHVTTDAPVNSARTAQQKYDLPVTPTHRATVPASRVPGGLQPAPGGPTTSGGTQATTNQPIPVRPTEIKPLNDHWWSRLF